MTEHRFRIGPAIIAIEAETPQQRINAFYPLFRDHGFERPDLRIHIRNDPPPSMTDTFDCEFTNHWKLFRTENRFCLEVYEQKEFRRKHLIVINSEWNQADFFLFSEEKDCWHPGEIFVPFVQWWLTGWLAFQKRGMIVHGSAVSLGEAALAFVGPSGAGKTTIARWCRDAGGKTVLNDERVILWQNQEGWKVSGTPWPGMLWEATPITQPLAAICILNKAAVNQFVPWSQEMILTHLLPEAFFPIWDFGRTDGLVETASRLIQEIPCGELSFRNDASIVNYLEELVSSLVSVSARER